MLTYNGFTARERDEVGRLQRRHFKDNPGDAPRECLGCGKRAEDGHAIDAHLEDYSRPITGILGLCTRCHYWVHHRFGKRAGFERYLASLGHRSEFLRRLDAGEFAPRGKS